MRTSSYGQTDEQQYPSGLQWRRVIIDIQFDKAKIELVWWVIEERRDVDIKRLHAEALSTVLMWIQIWMSQMLNKAISL